MIPCLNQATLMKTPTDVFITAAAAAGIGGIELRTDLVQDFIEKSDSNLDELAKFLQSKNMKVLSFNSLEDFSLADDSSFRSDIAPMARRMMDFAHALDCDLIVAVPSFLPQSGTIAWAEIKKRTQERLEYLINSASGTIKIGFEFIGFPNSSVRTLEQAMEVVSPLHKRYAGQIKLVVDTFHYFLGGCRMAISEAGELLAMIHINDLPLEIQTRLSRAYDFHRILPGDGFLDLQAMLGGIGAPVPVSIELFNESYYPRDPDQVAKECYAAHAKFF